MKLRGLYVGDLRTIVEHVSTDKYHSNLTCDAADLGTQRRPGTNFTLAVKSSFGPGARRSWTGRRMPKACWHAHRDVMIDIFTVAPDSRLTSALADYHGRSDFLHRFPATAYTNVGSQMQPAQFGELCDCLDDGIEGVQWSRDYARTESARVFVEQHSADAMRWDPKHADDEISEWAKILKGAKS